jgi:hypothetical protein
MPPTGFEPEIQANERPQTHALDGAAIWIGVYFDFRRAVVKSVMNDLVPLTF